MKDLWRGVSAEIADTSGFLIHCPGQFFGGDALLRGGSISKLVILTVQAIEGTGMVENGQVFMAEFLALGDSVFGIAAASACGADKSPHTVGGKWIVVEGKISLVGGGHL